MKQIPMHKIHNSDLLRMIPPNVMNVIEIGFSSGQLARECKKLTLHAILGIDMEANHIGLAKRCCDKTAIGNIELEGDDFYREHSDKDCLVFGDALEYLHDSWRMLENSRSYC